MLFHLNAPKVATQLAAAFMLFLSSRPSAAEAPATEPRAEPAPTPMWERRLFACRPASPPHGERPASTAKRAERLEARASVGPSHSTTSDSCCPIWRHALSLAAVAWETEFSRNNGAGGRTLFDFGLAPVLTYALPRNARRGHALYAFVPLSFTLSHVPDVRRQAIEEHTKIGTGLRAGLGLGALIQASRHLGFSIELEWAAQRVSHELVYRALDGSAASRSVDLVYSFNWLNASAGFALIP